MNLRLLPELLSKGIISKERFEELKKEFEKSSKKEEDFILEKEIIPENTLFELKAKILGLSYKEIKPDDVSPDILELIPEEAAINYKMVPVGKEGDVVEIGMVYPEDIASRNALRFLATQEKFPYKVYLISYSTFENILKKRKDLAMETKRALEQLSKERGEILDILTKRMPGSIVIEEEAPVVKMVLVILRHAIEGNASDIHIEPGRDKLTVRFRVNGVLYPSLFLPLKVHPSIVARVKILAGLKIDETRIPQDGRFSAAINNKEVDFRVATFPSLHGEKVEIRVLDPSTGLKSFEELGLRGRNLEIVQDAIKKPEGLILSTGPTGSGKTTTQYVILRKLNKDSVNIVTIEDPIEYSIPGVNQSQIKPEIGYTFSTGLRQILRQDPNIIMIGEIRDEETASLVIHAALTGHLVLSTLHTHSSVGVIPRLIDMGIKPFLIPSTLKLVISQKLVRILCPNCKVKIVPSTPIKRYILEKLKNLPSSLKGEIRISESFSIYKNRGCERCNFTGYSGRVGIFEVFSMNSELAELIIKNPLESLLLKTAQRYGMLTMEQEGLLKVLEGETSLEEVERVVIGGENF